MSAATANTRSCRPTQQPGFPSSRATAARAVYPRSGSLPSLDGRPQIPKHSFSYTRSARNRGALPLPHPGPAAGAACRAPSGPRGPPQPRAPGRIRAWFWAQPRGPLPRARLPAPRPLPGALGEPGPRGSSSRSRIWGAAPAGGEAWGARGPGPGPGPRRATLERASGAERAQRRGRADRGGRATGAGERAGVARVKTILRG